MPVRCCSPPSAAWFQARCSRSPHGWRRANGPSPRPSGGCSSGRPSARSAGRHSSRGWPAGSADGSMTWVVTVACCLVGATLAQRIALNLAWRERAARSEPNSLGAADGRGEPGARRWGRSRRAGCGHRAARRGVCARAGRGAPRVANRRRSDHDARQRSPSPAASRTGCLPRRRGGGDADLELSRGGLCETEEEGVRAYLGVTRAHLQRLLVQRASGVRCRSRVAVTGVAQAQDSVTVGFAQGAPQRYDLVVGADGRHSTTRLLALGATAAQYAGTMAWRSVAPFRPDGLHHLQLYLGDGCFFGLVPVGENGTYGFAGLVSERFDDPAAGRLDRFRQRFAGFARPVEEYLAALGPGNPLHSAPIEWVNPEHGMSAEWWWSAMPRTRRHRTWARAAAWPWRMASSSRRS